MCYSLLKLFSFWDVQVAGRNVVLFVIFGCLEEMQSKPIVFFVFYAWSSIEIFRYPFYMLACISTEWKLLTWLRYNLWIPLYPLGVISEGLWRSASWGWWFSLSC